jgi:hypothetical protein
MWAAVFMTLLTNVNIQGEKKKKHKKVLQMRGEGGIKN